MRYVVWCELSKVTLKKAAGAGVRGSDYFST